MIVSFEATEEQTLIESSIHSLLQDKLPTERLREEHNCFGAAESAQWQEITNLGLFGLGLAENEGGIGYTLIEEVMAAIALGKNLASPNLLAQMIAAHLADSDDTRAAIIAGEAKASFLNIVNDEVAHLLDGREATHLVVVNRGVTLQANALSDADGDAVTLIDDTVQTKQIRGDYAPLARSDKAYRLSLLCAAYLSGMASATTALAVEYANTREQFGHPIAAFQALKHAAADMHVRAEAATSQCLYAATIEGAVEPSELSMEIACARLLASQAALANAKANIQMHGGMGFTAECDAHLYLKRSHLIATLGSSKSAERSQILRTSQ